jgi:hypothetical protein
MHDKITNGHDTAVAGPHLAGGDHQVPSIRAIAEATARHYGYGYRELVGPRRHKALSRARQVAVYLSHTVTAHSMPMLGRSFGGRDHSTILHACRKIRAELDRDAALAADLAEITREIGLRPPSVPGEQEVRLTDGVADHLDGLCRLIAAEAEATRRLSRDIADTIARLENGPAGSAPAGSAESIVKAAWNLVSATDHVAEARGDKETLAVARARQGDAYRRLKAALRAHEHKEVDHAEP